MDLDEAGSRGDVHEPRRAAWTSATTLEHGIVVSLLAVALVALLRKSAKLAEISDRRPASRSLTEPLVPPRLKSDADLYELLDRHANARILARFRALDVFRGITLCLMVFVNYGGGGFAVFTHSVWDGLTVADMVFPWFAWILGFSVFLSSSCRGGSNKLQALGQIGQRTVKLFALGLFVNNGDSWSEWRIPGVLQALSAAYLVVATADWRFPCKPNQNHVVVWHVMLAVLPMIVVNLLLTFTLHVPGCPTGYIGPGGLADGGAYHNCTGGAHLYVDSLVFGRDHIFQTPTCQKRYRTGPYDPEGLLNWLMVATTAYLGYLQAAMFVMPQSQQHELPDKTSHCQVRRLIICGSSLIFFSMMSGGLWLFPHGAWIPLNKNLWSLSYVLLTSGLAALLLALLVKTIEDESISNWSGSPFISVGKNSIAIYVMHEICQHFAPFAAKPIRSGEEIPHFELLLSNFVGVVTWIVVAQWMELRNIFIKI